MFGYITLKSMFSQIPIQNRVMVKYNTHMELVDAIQSMVNSSINELNGSQVFGADPIELASFDIKRVSAYDEDLHYEVVYRIKMNVEG